MEKGVSPDPGKSPSPSKRKFTERLLNPVFRFFNVDDDFPLLKKLATFVFAFAILFFMGTLFVPLNYYTGLVQASYDEIELVALTVDTANDPLNSLITEDGFMIKPAIQSSAGDRSEANQIFMYTVEAGDTLSTIAQQFVIKKETLIMENDLWNATSLITGSQLRILPVDGVSHLVKSGDTVSGLAKKYKVEAADILRQNKLEEGDSLVVDSRIIIPGGVKERPVVVYTAPRSSRGSGGSGGGTAPVVAPPGAASSSGGRLVWPTNSCGKLTQGFSSYHTGLDIACRARGPIYAAAAGKVVTAAYGWNGGYGNYVIIDHGGGMQTLYGHNEKLYVNVGDYVAQGDTIAWMGNTGNVRGVTGIHSHFEVRINGVKYNPLNFL